MRHRHFKTVFSHLKVADKRKISKTRSAEQKSIASTQLHPQTD